MPSTRKVGEPVVTPTGTQGLDAEVSSKKRIEQGSSPFPVNAERSLPQSEIGVTETRKRGVQRLLGLATSGEERTLAAELPPMLCALGGVERLEQLGVRPLVASAGEESIFNRLFGRDSIRMARDLLSSHPKVARATILELGRLQGTKVNPRAEEEPGRILHEMREGKEALELPWDFPYYGAVDATPLWVDLVHAYVQKCGPEILDEIVASSGPTAGRTVRDGVAAAVAWIEGRLDDPRSGPFLAVKRDNPQGINNQILEDSGDSVYDEHGVRPDTKLPYAPVAEQGYAWRALVDAAELFASTEPERASSWNRRAADLKKEVLARFWQPDLHTFAQVIAYDEHGQGRPFRTIASSPGQLLATGILDDHPKILDRLVARLFQPDLLAGAGIRTKSTKAARFREGGYHNGTVWPTISLEIKDGLLHCAQKAKADAIRLRAEGDVKGARSESTRSKKLMRHAIDLENRALVACARHPGFPEFFRGGVDGKIAVNTEWVRAIVDGEMNTLEQPPQPQGWTATGIALILERRGVALLESP